MPPKRIALTREEAAWLFDLIQRTAMNDILTHKPNAGEYPAYTNLIKKIKHVAET